MEHATSEHKQHLAIKPARKYNRLYAELFKAFKAARAKGYRVDFNWLWSKARALQKELTGNEEVLIRKHVIVNFIRRNSIRMGARQRNRKLSKEEFRNKLMDWHLTTRERLLRTGSGHDYDPKWGRFLPTQRFNVDQSPMPFAVNTHWTYHHYETGEDQHKTKVWISQPGSGLDKRQCTMQICFRPDGKQPRLGNFEKLCTCTYISI